MTSFKDYTPKTFTDIVFGSDASAKAISDICNGVVPFPASGVNGILLYGAFGTGKTTLATLLPPAIEARHGNGQADIRRFDVQQGNDGAKVIATIAAISKTMPLFGRYHYFLLDEVDLLKGATMASLKSAMNSPNIVFVMTTNNISEVDRGVQNRCRLVEFNAAPPERWLPLARRILTDRNVATPSEDVLLDVIGRCDGSARTIVNAVHDIASRIAQQQASPLQKVASAQSTP